MIEKSAKKIISKKFKTVYALAVCLFLLVFFSYQVSAQPAFKFDKPTKRQKLPFNFQRNLIIIKVMLNGKGPYNFMVDTGVNLSLITDPALIDSLQLEPERKLEVIGAGEDNQLEAFLTSAVTVELDGITAKNLPFAVLTEDILNLSNYIGLPVHGILGYDFFNSFVVKFNFITHKLTLYDPEKFQLKGNYISLPITIEKNKPYLLTKTTLDNNTTLELKYIIDTGAGHAISLETESHPDLKIPKPAIRVQVGRGLSGFINGYLGRVKRVKMGKYKLDHVLSSFPDHEDVSAKTAVARNGNMGTELLKRFHLIIDYSNQQIHLKPNSFFKFPFEHDMSGIELIAMGKNFHQYQIYNVHPGSPADKGGLKKDDQILFINDHPVSKMNLTQISKILHSKDGRFIRFLVKRNNELIYTTIQLKRQI